MQLSSASCKFGVAAATVDYPAFLPDNAGTSQPQPHSFYPPTRHSDSAMAVRPLHKGPRPWLWL